MASLPSHSTNSHGMATYDGNSTICRSIHASLAETNPMHCPHVSYFEESDGNGIMKCSHRKNYSNEDSFSPDDMDMFAAVATTYGWDPLLQTNGPLRVNESATCERASDERNVNAEQLSKLTTRSSCASYLETLDATGEYDVSYWAILLGMLVVIRLVGLYALKRSVMRRKEQRNDRPRKRC